MGHGEQPLVVMKARPWQQRKCKAVKIDFQVLPILSRWKLVSAPQYKRTCMMCRDVSRRDQGNQVSNIQEVKLVSTLCPVSSQKK